jgi:Thrombospondin type 3 repeat
MPQRPGGDTDTWMRASALIAVAVTFGMAAPAEASQGFGADTSQPAVDGCGMLNQTCAAFTEAHASPQTGVLTSVRLRYGGTAESVRFLVLRQSGDNWLNTEPLIDAAATAGDGNLLVPVRRPIQQGDRLGLQVLGSPSDFQFKASGGTCLFSSGEHAAGQVKSYDACNGITEPQGEVLVFGTVETDADGDGFGDDTQDTDDDNDGVEDGSDAFPLDPAEQADLDHDGIGDNADPDDDNDGAPDAVDLYPLNAAEQLDSDHDGIGNNADPDDDNDGFPDAIDAFPLDPTRSVGPGRAAGASLVSTSLTLAKSGAVAVRLRCASACDGTVVLTTASRVEVSAKRRVRLGSGSFRRGSAGIATARVRLSKRNQRLVRRLRRLRVRAAIATAQGRSTATLALRAGRR